MNFTISFSNLGAYIEKIKVRLRPPHEDGTLRNKLKHKIKVDNSPRWLV